ncbi:MAG: formate dehydrogenase subunit alpha [Armatimonadetes bacterium]|nr:formate dehydrogenase subunit alpha [Armatimonadota bacterium]
MLRVTLNGTTHEFPEGLTLLEAMRSVGIEVPTLCHDPRLKPYGGCRLCSVEVEGQSRLVASCTTPLSDGMVAESHSKKAVRQRQTILRLLAEEHPGDSPIDERSEFHRYLIAEGLQPSGAAHAGAFKDTSHPYIRVDMDKCVYCYRCVRICEEVQGQFVWRAWHRGDQTRIRPDKGERLMDSSCVSCGACVDTCPSGALSDVAVELHGVPDRWVRTTCPYCGVGCELEIGVKDDHVVVGRPVQDSPVNKGHLCVKGRYAHAFVHAEDRVHSPMIRRGSHWETVSWEEAYRFTADRLRGLIEKHGADSVGVLGSARATNEENYLAQKFARVVAKTNNVDCCARVCHGPSAAALKVTLGTGAATNCFDDIEVAQGFLVSGANPPENHPIVGARIKQQVLKGAKLVVIDPRKTELARMADVHLQINPGSNVPTCHAIAYALIEEGLVDEGFIAQRTNDFEAFKAFLSDFTPERVAPMVGVSAQDIRKAARVYGGAKPAMIFHGLGMTEHVQGVDGVRCLVNLALLTGNLGKPGSGENPLRGQNNVQGSAHMGCEPSHLAGYTPIAAAADLFEEVWKAPVPRQKGLNWMEMVDAAAAGKLKALYCIGYDVYFSNPNAEATGSALQNLELLIVQDLFMNETAREFAHVFLPVASNFEKDGTFMNSERRVQRVRKAIEPVGNTRPDWQVTCELAAEMGFGEFFAYDSPNCIWQEVQKVWKPGAGISYKRIEEHGIQWPCPDENHPGTSILHTKTFPIGDRAAFSLIPYLPTEEVVTDEFPMVLNTGRTLVHFNAGTMTYRTPNRQLLPTDFLEISPQDAGALEVADGEEVRVTSRYGTTTLPARVTSIVKPGQLFATFHDTKVFTNRITSRHRDRHVGTPEYKVTAVRIEKIPHNSH